MHQHTKILLKSVQMIFRYHDYFAKFCQNRSVGCEDIKIHAPKIGLPPKWHLDRFSHFAGVHMYITIGVSNCEVP